MVKMEKRLVCALVLAAFSQLLTVNCVVSIIDLTSEYFCVY